MPDSIKTSPLFEIMGFRSSNFINLLIQIIDQQGTVMNFDPKLDQYSDNIIIELQSFNMILFKDTDTDTDSKLKISGSTVKTF